MLMQTAFPPSILTIAAVALPAQQQMAEPRSDTCARISRLGFTHDTRHHTIESGGPRRAARPPPRPPRSREQPLQVAHLFQKSSHRCTFFACTLARARLLCTLSVSCSTPPTPGH
ncbi:hypothetical protein T484DRAFT_2771156 [Baffinella frigidus]|nr:hypothetical protein T484DRAFT_2771156 [Cryptophyta sp. CCMP2293]